MSRVCRSRVEVSSNNFFLHRQSYYVMCNTSTPPVAEEVVPAGAPRSVVQNVVMREQLLENLYVLPRDAEDHAGDNVVVREPPSRLVREGGPNAGGQAQTAGGGAMKRTL